MIKLQSLLKASFMFLAFCVAAETAMSAQTFTTLLDFQQANGGQPGSSLVQNTDGNFYGTSSVGGTNDGGTVFRMTPTGKLTTLYNFCAQTNCTDGSDPGQLVLGSDGNLYGFTVSGGANCLDLVNPGCGTIFKITATGKLTTLYSFCAQTNCTDGWDPDSLFQATDGNFYGTTWIGGLDNSLDGVGEIFKITPTGTLTVLYDFCSQTNCTDGEQPEGLMQAANGNFYGTTYGGGTNDTGCGTAFEFSRGGTLTTLHSFDAQDGCYIHSGLMQANDGNFYGVTASGGGPHRRGTVYKMSPSGTLTRLYSFCAQTNCADGETPEAALVQGTDGNLYGTTDGELGAHPNDGTIFQITTGGTLTTLHNFDFTDGGWPAAPLVQATNGTFYGTTLFGGADKCDRLSCGTVFSLSMGLGPFVKASPNFGQVGRVVRILGNNLTGSTSVSFNGTPATFTVVSSTYIQATVPSGATSGTIEVTTPTATLSSNIAFQILP